MRREEWREADRDSARIAVRAILVLALVVILVAGVWAVTVAWAPWKGAGEQRKATQGNASYRIAAYDRFYDTCAAVQSKEGQIGNLLTERESAPAGRRAYIDVAVTALRNSRVQLIQSYNADARKADTRGHFRASDLPYQLDPTARETSCTA